MKNVKWPLLHVSLTIIITFPAATPPCRVLGNSHNMWHSWKCLGTGPKGRPKLHLHWYSASPHLPFISYAPHIVFPCGSLSQVVPFHLTVPQGVNSFLRCVTMVFGEKVISGFHTKSTLFWYAASLPFPVVVLSLFCISMQRLGPSTSMILAG